MENGADEQEIRELIRDLIAPASALPAKERDGYTPRAVAILEEAHRQAARFGSALTGTEHILLALIREGENVAVRLLNTCGLQPQKIYADTLAAMGQDPAIYKEDLAKKQKRKGQTAALDQYSRDMTALAAAGKLDPVVGREEEISRVIQILSRRTKNNPCLVGESPAWERPPLWKGLPGGSWKEMCRIRSKTNGSLRWTFPA